MFYSLLSSSLWLIFSDKISFINYDFFNNHIYKILKKNKTNVHFFFFLNTYCLMKILKSFSYFHNFIFLLILKKQNNMNMELKYISYIKY